MLSFLDDQAQPLESQATQLLAPRPGTCRGGKGIDYPKPVPLGWSGEKLQAWVGGSRIGPASPITRQFGSPRSPNKTWVVFPTPLGLLLSGSRLELWRVPDTLGPAERLTDCTVADRAAHVACVRQHRVALIHPNRIEKAESQD
jgi:hypothetical protein